MKRRFFPWALAATACGALFLAGCSTTESRISAHPEIYQRLSPSDQELVQRGVIRSGMAQDAVFLAWGAPEQKTVANIRGRPAETWVYFSSTATGGYGGYPYWGYGPYYGGGFYGGGFYGGGGRFYRHHGRRYYGFGYDRFDPFFFGGTQIVRYPYKTISFQNGRVVAYQFLAPPRVY